MGMQGHLRMAWLTKLSVKKAPISGEHVTMSSPRITSNQEPYFSVIFFMKGCLTASPTAREAGG